jgi:hypothetical protein
MSVFSDVTDSNANEQRADDADADDEGEDVDEEDNFFTSIETNEAILQPDDQPSGHDAAHAPKLLKDAIEKGEVDVDESEAESEEKNRGEEEKKTGEEHHVHHRVSQSRGVFVRSLTVPSYISLVLELSWKLFHETVFFVVFVP